MRNIDWFLRYLLIALVGPLIYLNIWLMGQTFRFFEQFITITALSAIFALLLNYPIQWLEKAQIRRQIGILAVGMVAISVLGMVAITVVPLLIQQAIELLGDIPQWLSDSRDQINMLDQFAKTRRWPINLNQVTVQIERFIQAVLEWLPEFAFGTLGRIFDAIIIFVMTFYMLIYGSAMWKGLIKLLPKPYGRAISTSIQFNFQQFFISQLLLSLFMFVTLTIAFIGIKVRFALLLSLLIAVFELIPFIGATIGISLVILLVLLQGFKLAVYVAIASTLLQQIKDNILAPKLFGSFIGLNPLWVFIALLIGGRVAGLLGVLLSVPVAGTIKTSIEKIQKTERVLQVLHHTAE
jgi:predicted PurR-regulated permease PerM